MSRAGLRFRSIDVRRFPGFDRGGPRLPELGDGVNLVHGPNAAGKSTLARALLAALWPRLAPPGAALGARLELEGEPWEREIDAGAVHLWRSGAAVSEPALPPREIAERYLFSIDRLLAADDAELAAAIERESAGGYDPRSAEKDCDFRPEPARPLKLAEAARAAADVVARTERRQRELLADERRLRELEAELASARAASGRRRELELAFELHEAEERCREAARRLAELPALAERLNGGELAQLEEIDERFARLERERTAALAARNDAGAELARLALADGAAAELALTALEKHLEELEQAERGVARAQAERAAAEADLTRALAAVGPGGDPDRFRAAPPAELPSRLASLLDLAARRDAERALHERLDPLLPSAPPSAGDSSVRPPSAAPGGAAELLRHWLAAPAAGAETLRAALAAFIAVAVLAAAFELTVVPGLAALAGAAGVAAMVLVISSTRRSGLRSRLRADFERLGIVAPASWSEPAVRERLRALEGEAAAEREQVLASRLRAALGLDPHRLAELSAKLEEERLRLSAELGLAPADPLSLVRLVERLEVLERAADAGARALALEQLETRRRDETFRALTRRFEELGRAAPGDRLEARALFQVLGQDARRAALARQSILQLDAELHQRLEPEIASARAQREQIFRRLELEPAQETSLRAAITALPEFRAAAGELALARRERDRLREQLAEPSLAELDSAELRDRLEQSLRAVAEAETLAERVLGIRGEVARARAEHALEEALAGQAAALDELRAAREREAEAVAGWCLARHIARSHRERDASPILLRARDLFARFTHHRYRLEVESEHGSEAGAKLEAGGAVRLAAHDTARGRRLSLAALSSGTRVQLLLAVRIAFLERQERGLALPLLLDEVLANSDEGRAEAIIAALAELARDGRQLVCFTAQAAEIELWRRVFLGAGPGAGLTVLSLAALPPRELAREPVELAREIPSPAGHDRASYAVALGVPAIDRWVDDLGGVHLWHLVTDLEVLAALLRAGFERWGPFAELLARGGVEALTPGAAAEGERAAARARLLAEMLAAWRIGRGRPLDRPVLTASGAVSEIFLDAVSAEASAVDGAADRLLARLEAGAVKGFRSGKLAELERYLETEGYLDRRPPLSADSLRARLFSLAAADLASERLRLEDLERLLALLGGAGS